MKKNSSYSIQLRERLIERMQGTKNNPRLPIIRKEILDYNTAAKFADILGVTRQTMSKLEKLENKLSAAQYLAICGLIDRKKNEMLENIPDHFFQLMMIIDFYQIEYGEIYSKYIASKLINFKNGKINVDDLEEKLTIPDDEIKKLNNMTCMDYWLSTFEINDILSPKEEKEVFRNAKILINFESFFSIEEVSSVINRLKPYVLESNGKFILKRSWYDDIKNELEKNISLLDRKISKNEGFDIRLNDSENITYLWNLICELEKENLVEWVNHNSTFLQFVGETISEDGIPKYEFVEIHQDSDIAKSEICAFRKIESLFVEMIELHKDNIKDILPASSGAAYINEEGFVFLIALIKSIAQHFTLVKYNAQEENFERWIFTKEEIKDCMESEIDLEDLDLKKLFTE